ncbi:DUF695 domain-containing protein [Vibrio neptunius]|uniref:DUF695 domain-containing protein n=1 Tax=Vibrio neptunius TaxID=170651 RepID=UPI003315A8C4
MSLNLEETAWAIAQGRTLEYKFEIRFRQFKEKPPTTEYGQRLNIFWEMSDVLSNGFPHKSELDKLHDFENRLIEVVENDEFSIMSMVLTGNGEREFVFHTPDPQEFVSRLSSMPQEQVPYPIQINLNEDLEWNYYFDEIGNIEGA